MSREDDDSTMGTKKMRMSFVIGCFQTQSITIYLKLENTEYTALSGYAQCWSNDT